MLWIFLLIMKVVSAATYYDNAGPLCKLIHCYAQSKPVNGVSNYCSLGSYIITFTGSCTYCLYKKCMYGGYVSAALN